MFLASFWIVFLFLQHCNLGKGEMLRILTIFLKYFAQDCRFMSIETGRMTTPLAAL